MTPGCATQAGVGRRAADGTRPMLEGRTGDIRLKSTKLDNPRQAGETKCIRIAPGGQFPMGFESPAVRHAHRGAYVLGWRVAPTARGGSL